MFKKIRGEFRQIHFPDWKTLLKETIFVLIVSVLVAAALGIITALVTEAVFLIV